MLEESLLSLTKSEMSHAGEEIPQLTGTNCQPRE